MSMRRVFINKDGAAEEIGVPFLSSLRMEWWEEDVTKNLANDRSVEPNACGFDTSKRRNSRLAWIDCWLSRIDAAMKAGDAIASQRNQSATAMIRFSGIAVALVALAPMIAENLSSEAFDCHILTGY